MKLAFSITLLLLAMTANYCRADIAQDKFREIILKLDDFRQAEDQADMFFGDQLMINLMRNGWRLKTETRSFTKFLGLNNEEYPFSHTITIATLYALNSSNPKVSKIKFSASIALGEPDTSGIIAKGFDSDGTQIVNNTIKSLETAVEMANRAVANSVKDYTKQLMMSQVTETDSETGMRKHNYYEMLFSVTSDGKPFIDLVSYDVTVKQYEKPGMDSEKVHFVITMDDAKAVLAGLKILKVELDEISKVAQNEARIAATNTIRNERIMGDSTNDGTKAMTADRIDKLLAVIPKYLEIYPEQKEDVVAAQKHLEDLNLQGINGRREQIPLTGDQKIQGDSVPDARDDTGLLRSATPQIDPRRPIPRPSTVKNTRPAVLADNKIGAPNVGATGFDAKWSHYGAYLQKLIDTVQIQWDDLNDKSKVVPPVGTKVTIKFRLDSEGKISEIVDADSNGGEQAKRICISAITDRAPYGKWSNDMVAMLGDSQELTFTFYYGK